MPQILKRESIVGRLFIGGFLLGKVLEVLDSCRVSYAMYFGTSLATLGTCLFLCSKPARKIARKVQGK